MTESTKAEKDKREPLHPEETITSLWLVRHGDTQATEEGRLYCDPSTDLTSRGIEQSERLADWLSTFKPDLLISSNALRVVSTSKIIGERINLTPSVVEGFNEWQVGEWEGLSYWDIKRDHPQVYQEWSKDPIVNRPPGGESIVELCDRIKSSLLAFLSERRGKRVVFVTHAGIIRAILMHALGMPVQNFWRLAIPVASVSRVDISDSFATVHFFGLKHNVIQGASE